MSLSVFLRFSKFLNSSSHISIGCLIKFRYLSIFQDTFRHFDQIVERACIQVVCVIDKSFSSLLSLTGFKENPGPEKSHWGGWFCMGCERNFWHCHAVWLIINVAIIQEEITIIRVDFRGFVCCVILCAGIRNNQLIDSGFD